MEEFKPTTAGQVAAEVNRIRKSLARLEQIVTGLMVAEVARILIPHWHGLIGWWI